MINPQRRMQRLQADYEGVLQIHQSQGLIQVEQVLGDPPNRYLIRYTCRGIARVVDGRPFFSEMHQVVIELTATYPTSQPLLQWLTPIFHPNITPDGQRVCIGTWYPAKKLPELIMMLGEMIQYKNYASHDPLYLEASLWAMGSKHLFPVDKRDLLHPHKISSVRPNQPAAESDILISVIDQT